MLEQALIRDPAGRSIRQEGRTRSQDWDEVQDFCRRVYMPYRVTPLVSGSRPDATLRSARIGRITMTRFSYGVPIHLQDFDPGAGNILVLTTLRGGLRHLMEPGRDGHTGPGDSFVVDCSRTDYWLDGDAAHMQLNLTLPHRVMEETAARWYGFVPDDRLWTRRLEFGGSGSRWLALLDYAARSIRADRAAAAEGRLGAHVEELLCVELLREWAEGAGLSLAEGARAAAPGYIRRAEEFIAAMAREAPTIGDVARAAGVSARTLSEGFRRFRGLHPRDVLRDRRLEGLHADLLAARSGDTVTAIAAAWGYVNFGALAGAYRRRFGEPPSATLRRAVQRG